MTHCLRITTDCIQNVPHFLTQSFVTDCFFLVLRICFSASQVGELLFVGCSRQFVLRYLQSLFIYSTHYLSDVTPLPQTTTPANLIQKCRIGSDRTKYILKFILIIFQISLNPILIYCKKMRCCKEDRIVVLRTATIFFLILYP